MIKAKSLRIGNILQDPEGNLVEVIRLHENGTIEVHSSIHQFIDFNESDEPFFKPTALSEEILLKCRLQKEIYTPLYNLPYEYYHIYVNDKNEFIFRGLGASFVEIKHLHQLQNLYFALTGQELNTSGLI